jgi:competence protein ComEA
VAREPLQRRRLFIRLFRHRETSIASEGKSSRPLLTAADQAAVALFAFLALAWMSASWLARGGLNGEMLDIDSAEPLRATFQTDINSADWTELMQLPEIGEALARRIVESREQDGPFASHDDLDRVRGIGPKTLERIRPYLRPVK